MNKVTDRLPEIIGQERNATREGGGCKIEGKGTGRGGWECGAH